ncbi:hypothetical protein GOBAR_AA25200 [Gossypium barbadense]|uniref:Uncharacterized protein n=1 Tax=Gossypium barbadense TaxID=3634 RepID=A0A2P5WWK2_GOSBA|nr:hypothetical protein GOBAR_AA25200 [Gossypium barbadense]
MWLLQVHELVIIAAKGRELKWGPLVNGIRSPPHQPSKSLVFPKGEFLAPPLVPTASLPSSISLVRSLSLPPALLEPYVESTNGTNLPANTSVPRASLIGSITYTLPLGERIPSQTGLSYKLVLKLRPNRSSQKGPFSLISELTKSISIWETKYQSLGTRARELKQRVPQLETREQ